MPRTLASRNTVRIQLVDEEDEFFIDVLEELTFKEKRTLRAVFVEFALDGTPKAKSNLEEGNVALMELAIKGWNVVDEDGAVLPITRDNIDALREADSMLILQALSKQYEDMDESQKKA